MEENFILRVWHIPQVPGKDFVVDVDNTKEAAKLLMIFAMYDQFQYQNNIKPDFSNMSGVSRKVDGEWVDFFYEDEDGWEIDWDEFCERYHNDQFKEELDQILTVNNIKF